MIAKLKVIFDWLVGLVVGPRTKLAVVVIAIALTLSLSVVVMRDIQARHDAKVDRVLDSSERRVSELEGKSEAHEAEAGRIGEENVKLKVQLEQLAKASAETRVKTQIGEREIQRVKDKIDSDLAGFSIPADVLEQCVRACASAKQLGYIDQASPCDCQR